MILNKVMIAVVGLSIFSILNAYSEFLDFEKKDFKNCRDNCTVDAYNKEKCACCVKNCFYMKGDIIKIDVIKVCETFDKKCLRSKQTII